MHSPTAVRTRPANSHDIPRLVEVVNAAFSVEDFLEGDRTSAASVREMMAKGEFLVGECGGQIVASVYVEIRGPRAYFGMLAVDPAQQRRGLGTVMVAAAEDYCRRRGCQAIDINVLSVRPELPPVYRKLGYTELRTEPFTPSRPLKAGGQCHAVIMSKNL